MKFRYFIAALFLSLAVGCVQEEFGTLSEIQVSESYVSLPVGGGSTSVNVTASESWAVDASSVPSWLTVSPMSGSAGNSQISFSAESTKATNEAEVMINCGGKTQYINVIQYAEKVDPVILTVPEAIALIKTVDKGDGQSYNVDGEYYVRGIVCKIDEISVSYGNATYYLSEDGKFEDGKWLEVYRGYWLGGKSFTTGDEFSVGDELTIVGNLMSYKGTPETVQNTASVVSITKSLISVGELGFDKLPAIDTTFNLVVTAKESPLLVTSDSDWLQIVEVNPDGSFKLHADENTRTAERTATINISGPTARKSVSVTQVGAPATGASVTEIIAAADKDQVQTLPNTVVVALTTRGAVLSDGDNAIYAYGNSAAALKIGDAVKMSATKTTYNGVPELTDITDVFVDSEGNAVSYPEATDITGSIESYSASVAEYIKFSGTLTVSGNYYNIEFDGVDPAVKQGSIVYPVDALDAKGWDGKKITVTGYFNGLSSGGKFVNIIATKIQEFVDNPKGTVTNPYSPSEIAALLLGGTMLDENVYIKGKVSSILYTFSANYGTATFWISDDGVAYGVSEDKKKTSDPAHDFECYGVYWMDGEPWADGNAQIEVGDEVVMYGKTTVYNGVAETSNKNAHVYSVNMATTDANGIGNMGAPFNIAGIHSFIDAANAAKAAAEAEGSSAPVFPDVCVKGKISSILYTYSASYGTGTFWISDDGTAHGVSEDKKKTSDPVNDFECYGVYYLGGQPWAEGNDQIAEGDEVIVKGQYTIYNGIYETSNKKAYVCSHNGKTE
jgi:hypothetical protein